MRHQVPMTYYEDLRANRRMRSEAEVRAFEESVAAIRESSTIDIERLLFGFDDDTERPEVMTSLLHLVEAAPAADEIQALVKHLIKVKRDAPMWTQVLIARALHDNDTLDLLIALACDALPSQRAALTEILAGLRDDTNAQVSTQAIAALNRLSLC